MNETICLLSKSDKNMEIVLVELLKELLNNFMEIKMGKRGWITMSMISHSSVAHSLAFKTVRALVFCAKIKNLHFKAGSNNALAISVLVCSFYNYDYDCKIVLMFLEINYFWFCRTTIFFPFMKKKKRFDVVSSRKKNMG